MIEIETKTIPVCEEHELHRDRIEAGRRNMPPECELYDLSDFFKVESVSIAEQPRMPSGPSTSKSFTNALLVGLIAAMSVIGVLVFLYMRNDKINTSEDVEKYLGLTVLAVIPETDPKDEPSGDSRRRRR